MKSTLFRMFVFVCLILMSIASFAQFAGSGNIEDELERETVNVAQVTPRSAGPIRVAPKPEAELIMPQWYIDQEVGKIKAKPHHNACCSSGLCRVDNKEWSCNLMKNTPVGDDDDMDAIKLMSYITLSTNALVTGKSDTKYHGTKKFCNACYNKIRESYPLYKGKTEEDMENKIKDIKRQLASSGVERSLIKRFYRHVEQKRFYQKHKLQIERSLKKLRPDLEGAERETYIEKHTKELLCTPEDLFKDSNASSATCPEAKDHLNHFFQKYGLKFEREPGTPAFQLGENEDPFTSEVNNKINRLLDVTYFNLEKELKKFDKKYKKRDTDKFNKFYTKLFLSRKAKLQETCGQAKDWPNLNIKDLYKVMLNNEEKPLSNTELLYAIEGFEQAINMSNVGNPDLMIITRDVESICSAAQDDSLSKENFNLVNDDKDQRQWDGLLDYTAKDLKWSYTDEAYDHLKRMAKADCLSEKDKVQVEKFLCGDLSDRDTLLTLNMDEGVMKDDFSKLAYAKMQCNESLNVMNSSTKEYNKAFVAQTLPEYTFYMLGKKGWRATRDQIRDQLNLLVETDDFSEFFLRNTGLRDKIPDINFDTATLEKSRSFWDRVFGREPEPIPASIYDRYYDPVTKTQVTSFGSGSGTDFNGAKMMSGSGVVGRGPASYDSANGNFESTETGGNSQNVFNNFVGQSTQTDDLYNQNNYQSLNSEFTQSDLDQYKQSNQAQLDDILNELKGSENEQQENLVDYLNDKKSLEDIAKNGAGSSELQNEIEKLKKEIASERAKRNSLLDPNSPEGKLAEAQKRIDNLEAMIRNMQNSRINNGKMTPAGAGNFDNREQGKLNQYLQDYGQRPPRQYEIAQGDDGRLRKIASTNIPRENIMNEKRFEEVLSKPETYFEYNNKHKELVLKTKDGYEYTIKISDVEWDKETGEVVSFNYKGKKVIYKDLNDNSKVAINKFLKEKTMAQEINDAIVQEIKLNPQLKGPSPEMARYIQLLCGADGMDPTNPKCEGYLPEVAKK